MINAGCRPNGLATPTLRVAAETSDLKVSLTDEQIQLILAAVADLSSKSSVNSSTSKVGEPPQPIAAPPPAPPSRPAASGGESPLDVAVTFILKKFQISLGRANQHPGNRLARKIAPVTSFVIDHLVAIVAKDSNGATDVSLSVKAASVRDTRSKSDEVFKQLFGPVSDSAPTGLRSAMSPSDLSSSGDWDARSSGTSPSEAAFGQPSSSDGDFMQLCIRTSVFPLRQNNSWVL